MLHVFAVFHGSDMPVLKTLASYRDVKVAKFMLCVAVKVDDTCHFKV